MPFSYYVTMKRIWNWVVRINGNLRRMYKRPYTDKAARTNVIIWSLVTLAPVASLGFDVFVVGPGWGDLVNIAVLVFDATMLTWSIQGTAYRRRYRAAERYFIEVLEEIYPKDNKE